MKIALIHYSSAPVIGGVERILEEHARLFARHGHEITIFSHRGGVGEAGPISRVHLPSDPSTEAQASALRVALPTFDAVFVHNVLTMPFHEGLALALASVAADIRGPRFVA